MTNFLEDTVKELSNFRVNCKLFTISEPKANGRYTVVFSVSIKNEYLTRMK